MNDVTPARGHVLATLLFAIPLALMGLHVAGWPGLLAGALVGAMIAARMLMRGALESSSIDVPAVIIAADFRRESNVYEHTDKLSTLR
jgi:hypothetical protein